MGFLQKVKSLFIPTKYVGYVDSINRYNRDREKYWSRNSIYLQSIYNMISTDVSMSQFRHVKKTNQDGLIQRTEITGSDLTYVMKVRSNKLETPINFWSRVIRVMLKHGVAIVLPVYQNGSITELQLAESFSEANFQGDVLNLTFENGQSFTYPVENLWIFENPKKQLEKDLENMSKLIDDNLRELSYKINDKGKNINGLLKLPYDGSLADKKKDAETRVQEISQVAQYNKIGYLNNKEEFQELHGDYSVAGNDELETAKMQLYFAWGINENLLTCNYTDDQYRAYFNKVIKMYQRVIAQEINSKYFSQTARTQGQSLLVFNDLLSFSSLKDLTAFVQVTKMYGVESSNELRDIFGQNGYSGGDTYETNLNMVQINPDGSLSSMANGGTNQNQNSSNTEGD
jgi:phage portal protein BeeE